MENVQLEELLRSRLGNFVPKGRRHLIPRRWSAKLGNFTLAAMPSCDDAVREEVCKYLRGTFYKEAIVPGALRLWESDEASDAIFKQEMDLYLNSNNSFLLRCNETGRLMGCFLNCYWPRDPGYDIIRGFTMGEWHKAAAKIAMEVCPERPEPIWRDFQYQQIYNACQMAMAERGLTFCVYFGPGYLAPEARGLGIRQKASHHLGTAVSYNIGLAAGMPTYPAMVER